MARRIRIEKFENLEQLVSLINAGKINTWSKAVLAKCLECSYFDKNEVKNCPCTKCPLHQFRLGVNPYRRSSDEELGENL